MGTSTRLEMQADSILRANGSSGLVCILSFGQVFEPFKRLKLKGRLSGPVPPGARCGHCGGPRRVLEPICQGCVKAEVVEEFASVSDYWLKMRGGYEPDFAPELVESIEEREQQLGLPAARWSRS
jgi:hypothetical protein